MTRPKAPPTREQELVRRWRQIGRLLDAKRWAELAAQSRDESRSAAFDMLQLGGMLPVDAARERYSGMIDMQRLFARWHRDRAR